jgi:RNA polymerase sigma factor (sigma-70 family)
MNATLARLTRIAVDLSHETDARLLDCFLAGSQPAFRELVYRHGPLVFGVCHRVLRHRQDAEDAFQATFLVLARRAGDVWPRDAVGSWLYGVAYRVAQKARVQRARRQGREQPLDDVAQHEGSRPEPDTAEVIDRVVRKLPEVYRAAVIACDLEGLSRKDAAGQLGWTEGTLSGRLARARKLLADRLRKAGVTLPAAGLGAVLGTAAPVRAGLEETVAEVVSGNAAAGVPAPVAALAEGVVQSMCAFKLKAVAAAVLVSCTIGYGAWAAGAGDGPGASGDKQPGLALANGAAQPRSTAATEKLKVPPALELLQGKWRIVNITEKGKMVSPPEDQNLREFDIVGKTLAMLYRDGKRDEYRIAVDDTKTTNTIDMFAASRPVGKGIYRLTAPAATCVSCHSIDSLGPQPDTPDLLPLCKPGQKKSTGLLLAVALEGPRPTKFGGDGVVVFSLERVGPDAKDERAQLEKERARIETVLAAMGVGADKEELARLAARVNVFKAKIEENDARTQLQVAQVRLEEAQAQTAVARIQLELATKNLKDAQDRLAAANKGQPAAPVKDNATFTVHIRTQLAPEETLWVKLTGSDTVLEALAHAAKNMAIKADAVTVWLVRGKEVLPVDLAAIYNGDAKTNYALKPGDRLFVQAKPAK